MEFLRAASAPLTDGLGGPGAMRSSWRAAILAALLLLIAAVGVFEGGLGERSSSSAGARERLPGVRALESLPVALKGVASSSLGASHPAYGVTASRGGFAANNPSQNLRMKFSRFGVGVTSGKLRIGLALDAVGYGALRALGTPAMPRANGNRVSYSHAGIDEWYVNGPLGLEQGFTIARPRGARNSTQLMLGIAVRGNARASLQSDRRAVTLARAGAAPLNYGALSVTDARGHKLPASLSLKAGQIVITIDTRGGTYPLRVDPLVEQQKLSVGDEIGAEPFGGESFGGRLGASVALSEDGSTALVGASGDDENVGAAFVYTRSGSNWIQQGPKLTVPAKSELFGPGNKFGASVALSADGSTALIGSNTGASVFTRSGGVWSQQGGKLTNGFSPSELGHGKAVSVALSADGDTALIASSEGLLVFTRSGEVWSQQGGKLTEAGSSAALSADGNTALMAGSEGVLAFTRSGGVWSQQGGKLTKVGSSVALSGDGNTALIAGSERVLVFVQSGGVWSQQGSELTEGASSVALSGDGNTALIGEASEHMTWVFTRSGSTWTQGPKLTGAGEVGATKFGASVALSGAGTTALVGGPLDNGLEGAAWVFTRSGEEWMQPTGKLTGGAYFGWSVAISGDGNTALVGEPTESGFVGAAFVFTRSHGTWTLTQKLTPGGPAGDSYFGYSVALSRDGKTALVGGPGDEAFVGAAWVFSRSGETWTQQGSKLTGGGGTGEVQFGFSVALSEDGSTALVGGVGDNGFIGAAWAFTRTGETWTQQGSKLTGEGESGSGEFGYTVAISANGNTGLITAAGDHEGTGAAWAFARTGGVWKEQGAKLTGSEETGKALAGWSEALSADGNTAIISGPKDNGGVGAAWVFSRSGETWSEQGGKIRAGGEAGNGEFGYSVALSGDGNKALIGADLDGGPSYGAIYVFTSNGGATWSQEGSKITPTDQTPLGPFEFGNLPPDGFGFAVALSSNGNTALISSPTENLFAGAIWAYVIPPTVLTRRATEVTTVTAQLNGTVTPHGTLTECFFEYGETASYGSSVPCSFHPHGTGERVFAPIAGLNPDTVYHFRIVASNGDGISKGNDRTLTTLLTSATGEASEPAKPAKATDGELSAEASGGTGSITVGAYGSQIGGPALTDAKGTYVQVYRSEEASFTKIDYKDCELGGAKAIWWENPEGVWEPIRPPVAVYTETPVPCITVTATEQTTPSVAQLSDPRHVGGPTAYASYGKCEPAKHGHFSDAVCLNEDVKNGKPKGKYEWLPAPVGCFALKHGRYAERMCATEHVVKGKPKGLYERGENAFTGSGGVTRVEVQGQPMLECKTTESKGQLRAPVDAVETITLTECARENAKCMSSGAAEGTIVSEQLEGYPYEEEGEMRTVLAGSPIMSFTCGGVSFTLSGVVAGRLVVSLNAPITSSQSSFDGSSGLEELQLTEGTGAPHPATLSLNSTTVVAQPLELRDR
jgi:hypothetical protein